MSDNESFASSQEEMFSGSDYDDSSESFDDENDSDDSDWLPAKAAKKKTNATAAAKPDGKKASKPAAKKATKSKKKDAAPKSFTLKQNSCAADYCEKLLPFDASAVFSESTFHDQSNNFGGSHQLGLSRATGGTVAVLFAYPKAIKIVNMRPGNGKEPQMLLTLENDPHNPEWTFSSTALVSRDGQRVALLSSTKKLLWGAIKGDKVILEAPLDLSTTNSNNNVLKDLTLSCSAFADLPAVEDSSASKQPKNKTGKPIIVTCSAIIDLETGAVTEHSFGTNPERTRLWYFTDKKTGSTSIRLVHRIHERRVVTIEVTEVTGLDQPTIAGIGGKIISEFNVNFPEMCSMAVDHDTGYCAMGGSFSPKFFIYDLNSTLKQGKVVGKIARLGTTISFRVGACSKWQTMDIAALPAAPGIREYPSWIAANSNNSDSPTMDCIDMKPSKREIKAPVSERTAKRKRKAGKGTRGGRMSFRGFL